MTPVKTSAIPPQKLPYAPPTLTNYGSVTELTQAFSALESIIAVASITVAASVSATVV